MGHPSDGVLRRLLDEPAGVPDADREHTEGCAQCLGLLTTMRADAAAVGTALATHAGDEVDVDAALRRLPAAGGQGVVRAAAPRTGRPLALVRRPAVAALAAAAVLAGAGTAAATGWLPIFRAEQVAPVSFDTADLVALPDLRGYGELDVEDAPDVREVPDAAAAASASGLDLPEVGRLPGGVRGEPAYQVGRQVEATFTFSAERARRTAGAELPPVPAGLDGAKVRLVAGPGVAQVWESSSGAPALVVGRAKAPTAFSSGVPFETLRDYVLSLPGLPDDVATQLRTFAADGSTLPVPVPSDRVTTRSEQVGGRAATVLASRDGLFAAVVWVDGGVLTAVGGSLSPDEVLAVARGLR